MTSEKIDIYIFILKISCSKIVKKMHFPHLDSNIYSNFTHILATEWLAG